MDSWNIVMYSFLWRERERQADRERETPRERKRERARNREETDWLTDRHTDGEHFQDFLVKRRGWGGMNAAKEKRGGVCMGLQWNIHITHTYNFRDTGNCSSHWQRSMWLNKSQQVLSTKTECDYLSGWIKKQSHTQKSHPKWWTPEI